MWNKNKCSYTSQAQINYSILPKICCDSTLKKVKGSNTYKTEEREEEEEEEEGKKKKRKAKKKKRRKEEEQEEEKEEEKTEDSYNQKNQK